MRTYQDAAIPPQAGDGAGKGNARRHAKVVRIPVTEVGGNLQNAAASVPAEDISPAPTADQDSDTELQKLRRAHAALQRQAKAREDDLRRANKRLATLSERLQTREKSLAQADAQIAQLHQQTDSLKAQVASLDEQVAHTGAKLEAANAARDRLTGSVTDLEATVRTLTGQIGSLQATIDARDASIAQLQQTYRQLYDTHATLVHDLEEGTDRFSQRKEQLLQDHVRDALAQWTRHCQQMEPAPTGDEQMRQVNEVNEGMRRSMVDVTNAFQRDLADIRVAMESLEATRSALRKDLDLWQQNLYRGSYERLARCLQSLDVEIWRTMQTRLDLTAREGAQAGDEAVAAWDELIDHLQILSEYLKSSCECFGLRFFHASPEEVFDQVRHQVFGAAAADCPEGATVRACVSAGVEAQTADGETALLRPALVTLSPRISSKA